MRIFKSLGAALVTFYFIGVFFSQLTFNPYKWFMFSHQYNPDVVYVMLLSLFLIVILILIFHTEVFNEEVD